MLSLHKQDICEYIARWVTVQQGGAEASKYPLMAARSSQTGHFYGVSPPPPEQLLDPSKNSDYAIDALHRKNFLVLMEFVVG